MMEWEITAQTALFGLLGHPVGHSLSPCLQNALARHFGHDLRYLAYDVEPGELETAVSGARALGIRGLNVTVPHKQAVVACLAGIETEAERIGAVNTLKLEEDGWHGYNTDMPGFLRAMASDGVDVKGQRVVMLGAGGAANAVLCGLLASQAKEVLVYNRSAEKAHALVKRFSPYYPATECIVAESVEELIAHMEAEGGEYLAVQTTSLGMSPNTQAKPVDDEDFYRLCSVGYDIIFNPAETAFMRAIRTSGSGKRAYNGLKMLLYQGICSYEIWNGVKADDETAEKILKLMQEKMGIREDK